MRTRVDTDREAAIHLAALAIEQYGLPRGSTVTLVSVSENEIYRVDAPDGQQWALRLQRPGYQSERSLDSEIAWLAALRADGVVATPIPFVGLNGEWVQTVPHPLTGELRHVVLFAWEHGHHPTIETDLRPCFRSLGAIIARMHAHSRAWQRPPGFERFTWDLEATLGEPARWGQWRNGLGMTPARIDLFNKTACLIQERLIRYGAGADRFGLVHYDLRLANLLLHQDTVKVIDFDDCGFSWYMADLANCLSFYEHLPQATRWMASLLEGYRTTGELTREDEEELATFVLLRRLQLVAWIGSHPGTVWAQSLGAEYTAQTVSMCASYLASALAG